MGFAAAQRAVLTAHPSTAGDVVRGLAVHVLIEEPGILRLVYALDADLSRVRVPSSRAGSRTDGLWRHTCFEAFVAPADAPGYCELNFSPSLDWLLVFVPVSLVAELLDQTVVVFITSALAIVPLAGLIGRSTDQVARRLGSRAGGLLNATLGKRTMVGCHTGRCGTRRANPTSIIRRASRSSLHCHEVWNRPVTR